MKKETERVKTYYKPTTDTAPQKLKVRRQKIRECNQKKRRLLKQTEDSQIIQQNESCENQQELQDEIDNNPGPCDSTSTGAIVSTAPVSSISTDNQKFQIKMDFKKKRNSKGKAISKTKLKRRTLGQKVKNLIRRNETLRERVYRGSCQHQIREDYTYEQKISRTVWK